MLLSLASRNRSDEGIMVCSSLPVQPVAVVLLFVGIARIVTTADAYVGIATSYR